MEDINGIVRDLLEFGGIKVRVSDYDEGINTRWKINAKLREIDKKQSYSTAIVYEEGIVTIVAWGVDKYFSKRLNEFTRKDIKLIANKYESQYVPDIAPLNDSSDDWIDPANKEVLDKIAEGMKLRRESKLNEIIDKL